VDERGRREQAGLQAWVRLQSTVGGGVLGGGVPGVGVP